MSFAGRPQDGLENFGFDPTDSPSLETVLPRVIIRHNMLVAEAETGLRFPESDAPAYEKTYRPPELITFEYGNVVAVDVQSKANRSLGLINIGFFSPLKNAIVLFPELVDPDEAPVINRVALAERWKEIAAFSHLIGNASRVDYEDKRVQDHHTEQDLKLSESGLMRRIIDSHNDDLDFNGASNSRAFGENQWRQPT
jgi:hypothetical protein